MMTQREKRDYQLKTLLRDFGYRVEGKAIIEVGIRGFCSSRLFGYCRDLFDAAEQLCPIVREDEYTTRFAKITNAV